MKKLLITIIFLTIICSNAHAVTLGKFSARYLQGWMGIRSTVSTTTLDLNSAFTFNSSGVAYGVKFVSPVSQTSGNLTVYAYLTAKTGSPTTIRCALYQGPSGADDDDRPNSTVLDSATADVSGVSAPGWVTFSLTASSMTVNNTYWLVITNETGTPASNFPTFRTRSANLYLNDQVSAWTTADGFTTDPVSVSGAAQAPVVIKFNDGQIFGNPYASSTSHASNQNYRGQRFKFDSDIDIAGFITSIGSNITITYELYQGSTLIESVTPDLNVKLNSGVVYFTTIRRFTAGLEYDLVVKPTTNSTALAVIDAGASPPADVSSAMFTDFAYVDGATPGSFTATQGGMTTVVLVPDNLVAGTAATTCSSNTFGGNVTISGMTIR